MALPTAQFDYLGDIYSPFSGLPAEPDDDPNADDLTLLFIYYGSVGEFAYISPRVEVAVGGDAEDADVEDLIAGLQIDGGLVLNVNTDWNGLNFYAFAPADGEVSFTPAA